MNAELLDLIKWLTNKKRNIHCLLVEPKYYSTYPPLGLLKISSLVKSYSYTTELVSPYEQPKLKPDIIFVTSLFTYGWRKVKEAVEYYRTLFPKTPIILGGIYASLMPEHAKYEIRPDYIWQRVIPEAEDICPDYSLVPEWDGSILFSSRGCIRRCPFCVVWKIESQYEAKNTISHLINPKYTRIIFWDNNFLASPYKLEIFEFLEKYRNIEGKKVKVDFNQGLDARLLTLPFAEKISNLKYDLIRLAYDKIEDRKYLLKAVQNLTEVGIKKRKILVYMLYNFQDTPDDFLERLKDVMDLGIVAYPMRYQPNDSLEKDKYVATSWTPELLEMVAKARRVLGSHGAFPPYDGLIKKIIEAESLDKAMYLREINKNK
ncbi:hypothetical protein ACAG39_01810 [Caldicellulosiruptoraceae bacterium PP1]